MTAAPRSGTSAVPPRPTPAWWPTPTPTRPTAPSASRSPAAPCARMSVRCWCGYRTTSSTSAPTCARPWRPATTTRRCGSRRSGSTSSRPTATASTTSSRSWTRSSFPAAPPGRRTCTSPGRWPVVPSVLPGPRWRRMATSRRPRAAAREWVASTRSPPSTSTVSQTCCSSWDAWPTSRSAGTSCGNRAADGRPSQQSASGPRPPSGASDQAGLRDVDVWPGWRCLKPGSQCGVRSLCKGDLEVLLSVAAVDLQGRRNQDLGPFAGYEGPTGPDVERCALPTPGRTQGQTAQGEPLEPGRAIARQAEAPTSVGRLTQRADRQRLAARDQPPADEGGGENHQDDQQGAADQPLAGEQQAMHGRSQARIWEASTTSATMVTRSCSTERKPVSTVAVWV